MEITSINNPKVKEWIKLKEKKYRDINNLFIVEGDHLVEEALKSGYLKEIIATIPSYEVESLPFYLVNDSIMKKLSYQVSSTNVIGICHKLNKTDIEGNVCILDNIQDPGNLGTIIRSAKAFNIKTIIMSRDTVDLYNEKVVRSTEGMLFDLNFRKNDLNIEINNLKENGYRIYGTNVVNGTSLKNISFSKKNAIIIGNEGKGMSEVLNNVCDEMIYIPISCESLNASVAASIIFYEMS